MTGPRKTTRSNPFRLTDGQCDVMELLVEHGTAKGVADAMGRTHQSVNNTIWECCKKMGVRSYIHAALKWDRKQRMDAQLVEVRSSLPPTSVFSMGRMN